MIMESTWEKSHDKSGKLPLMQDLIIASFVIENK